MMPSTTLLVIGIVIAGLVIFMLTRSSPETPHPKPARPSRKPAGVVKPTKPSEVAPPPPAPAPVTSPTALPTTPASGGSGDQALWDCMDKDGKFKSSVKLWWGFKESDATWACNQWRSGCKGSCTAIPVKTGPNQERWMCNTPDGKTQDVVKINWGYGDKDGAWACNQWVGGCAGKCTAAPLV